MGAILMASGRVPKMQAMRGLCFCMVVGWYLFAGEIGRAKIGKSAFGGSLGRFAWSLAGEIPCFRGGVWPNMVGSVFARRGRVCA